MERIFGSLTMVLALLMIGIGFPLQIIKHYKEKRCGISFLLVVLPIGVYALRLAYGLTIRSWYIAIPDLMGTVLSFVMLVQFFLYRKKP